MSVKQKSISHSSVKETLKWRESSDWISVLILFAYGFVPVLTPNWETFDSNGPKFLTFSLVNLLVIIYFLILEKRKNADLNFLGFLRTGIGLFYSILIIISLLSFFKSINVIESIVHFGKIFTAFSATWIIASMIRKNRNILIYLIVGLTGLLIVDSFRVFWDIYRYIIGELSDILFIKAGYSNKNILAAAIFIKLPFAIYLLTFRSGWLKNLGLIGAFFGILSILFMSTRAFYLGLLVVSFFYIVFLAIRYFQTKNLVEVKKIIPFAVGIILAFAVFSSVQNFFYPKSGSRYNEDFSGRLATISTNEGGGYRLISWIQTSNLIKKNPLLGVGLGNWKIAILEYENPTKPDFTYHLKTHNDFLEITSEVGIMGLVCFLALFLLTFFNLTSALFGNKNTDQLGFLFLSSFGLLAYSFDAFFNFPQDRPEIQSLFAIYLGLSVGISPYSLDKINFKLFENLQINFLASYSKFSKFLLIGLFLFSLFSTSILYLNFKSLRIQRKLKEEQVAGKSLLSSDYLLDNFPPIPNLSSTSDPINGLIGKKLNDEKKYEEAITVLKKSNPNPFDTRREFYLAYAYFNINQLDSAESYIKLAHSMKPLHFLFIKFYANILESKNKKDDAIELLDKYLSNSKLEPDAWKYSAALYHETGNGDKVMQLMDSASNYFPKNEEIIKLKEFYTYKYLIPHYENASKLYNEKNYSEAIWFFELSYPDFQKHGDPNKLPDFLNSWGFSLLETGKVKEASEIFTRVVGKYPSNYFALKNLGFIAFQHQKNYPLAIDFYLKSLKADNPDLFQSYMNLGTIYLIQGEKDLAISNYETALSHGKSEAVIKNLYLLWKEKGNSQKSDYYLSMTNKQ